jgi:hypothetical protein
MKTQNCFVAEFLTLIVALPFGCVYFHTAVLHQQMLIRLNVFGSATNQTNTSVVVIGRWSFS